MIYCLSEKPLTLDILMGKAPIPGVFECDSCGRNLKNLLDHSDEYVEPWADFTPCENFTPARWAKPISDSEFLARVNDELSSLMPRIKSFLEQDNELHGNTNLALAIKTIYKQQGWCCVDGKEFFDDAVNDRRTRLYFEFQHEMRRRKFCK